MQRKKVGYKLKESLSNLSRQTFSKSDINQIYEMPNSVSTVHTISLSTLVYKEDIPHMKEKLREHAKVLLHERYEGLNKLNFLLDALKIPELEESSVSTKWA